MQRTQGRCPHCEEPVLIEVPEGQPGEIMEHGCPARFCQYPACSVTALKDQMVQLASGEWYCPNHALVLVSKDLVSLYRGEGDADWTAISEIIAETLPDLVTKAEAQERRRP